MPCYKMVAACNMSVEDFVMVVVLVDFILLADYVLVEDYVLVGDLVMAVVLVD